MKDEKKKNESGSKILSFDISDEMLENPEIDRFLKDSLIQEADKLETELNQSPDLVGVGASDDLFMSIVEKLKEQGIWEEADEDSTSTESIDAGSMSRGAISKNSIGTEPIKPEPIGMNSMGAESIKPEPIGINSIGAEPIKPEPIGINSMDGEPANSKEKIVGINPAKLEESRKHGNGTGRRTGNGIEHNVENTSANQAEIETINAATDASGDKTHLEAGRELTDSGKATDNKQVKEEISAELADINKAYHLLSEEDLADMTLGRQVREKKEKKAQRIRYRRKALKRVGVAAAALAIIFGFSMTSDANRRLALKAWDGLLENMGFRMPTNYLGDMESVRSKTKEEGQALEQISRDLNIAVIDFEYLPEGMEYQGYEILLDSQESMLFYSYKEKIVSVTMTNLKQEGSNYYVLDNEAVLRDTVVNDQDIKAQIWETNLNMEEETYIAEMEYDGCRYVLNGIIPLEEMKKILEFAFIL